MPEENRFYQLVHLGGPRGFLREEPSVQEQDKEAEPAEGYVVVFFPKITGLGVATLKWPGVWETLSRSPEVAIAKFMDRIKEGEAWDTYYDAGHRVRKVRLTDLGDVTPETA